MVLWLEDMDFPYLHPYDAYTGTALLIVNGYRSLWIPTTASASTEI